jgi:hypothetical protein
VASTCWFPLCPCSPPPSSLPPLSPHSNIDSLPIVAKWIPYISFIRWSFQALATNEFQGSTIKCSASDVEAGQCVTEGDQVLRNYFKANHSIAYPLLGQFILILALLSLAYLLLVCSRVRYISVGHVGTSVKTAEANLSSSVSPSPSPRYDAVSGSEDQPSALTVVQNSPSSGDGEVEIV